MNEENVIVTGGRGFIGSNFTEYLLSQGHKVTIYDICPLKNSKNLEKISNNSNLTYIQGDIRDTENLKKVITKVSKLRGKKVKIESLKERRDLQRERSRAIRTLRRMKDGK